MPEWTPLTHLQEAFRKQLFRLIDQYLSFPDEATHGRIIRTLVMYQQARMVLESEANTLPMQTGALNGARTVTRLWKIQRSGNRLTTQLIELGFFGSDA
jgi:hypothetical protein